MVASKGLYPAGSAEEYLLETEVDMMEGAVAAERESHLHIIQSRLEELKTISSELRTASGVLQDNLLGAAPQTAPEDRNAQPTRSGLFPIIEQILEYVIEDSRTALNNVNRLLRET